MPIEEEGRMDTGSAIIVASLDAKYEYETNRTVLALTWTALGLSVLLGREPIEGFVIKPKNGGSSPSTNTTTTRDQTPNPKKKDRKS